MNSFIEIINDISIRWSDGMWLIAWQSAALAAIIYLVTLCIRRASAAACFWLWMLVPLRLLVMPLITISLPLLPAAAPELEGTDIGPLSAEVTIVNPAGTVLSEQRVGVEKSESMVSPMLETRPIEKHVLPSVWALLMTGWLVGLALCLARLFRGWRRVRRIAAEAVEAAESGILESAQRARTKLGLRRMPKILVTKKRISPFLFGVLRSVLVVPEGLIANVRAEELIAVLAHEFAHLRRRDPLIGWLLAICETVYFFNPIFYFVKRRILFERERACDSWVVTSSKARSSVYANALISTAAICRGFRTNVGPVGAVAESFADLKKRLTAISRNLKPKARLSISALILLIILGSVCTPGILLTARAEKQTEVESKSKEKVAMTLHQAAADGDLEQVKLLISKGANVNEKDEKGWTPLHTASWNGRKDVADALVAEGANVNDTDVLGQTPLHLAITYGGGISELILSKGANVNARDKRGNTPLHVATKKSGTREVVEVLVSEGADINAMNDLGITPLHIAVSARKRHDKVVEYLLANGADINAKDKNGFTPLHSAAANSRRKERVELLLKKGAVLEQKNDRGITPFLRATFVGNKEIMELLLDRGADINSTHGRGLSALHLAARAGNNDIVKLLFDKGADLNVKGNRGETPAHLAAVQNHKDTVELLISKGAEVSTIQLAACIGDLTKVNGFIDKGISVNARDGYWFAPLHAATGAGQKEVAEFLISKGALVNAKAVAEGPGTPLHYAIDGGSKEVTELLVNKGALINTRNRNEETPLHLASKKGYNDLVRLLVANKADVNAKTQNGWTPLHFTAENGHEDIAALLIENGANIDIKSDEPKGTPLFYAARSGHKGVIKLLIDKGATISEVDALLYYSCEHLHKDLVEFFIQKGAKVNKIDGWGNVPAFCILWNWDANKIADSNQTDIFRLLFDHGANPNAKERWDWSLLHYAAEVEVYIDMARILLDKGANPNAREIEGRTPLHHAANSDTDTRFKAMIELLISRGADVNVKDYEGRTPLTMAKDNGLTEIVALLRKHGAKE